MVIKDILEKSDALFAAGKQREAAAYLEEQASLAQSEEEWETELSIINELMGYYRSISQLSKAWDYAFRAMQITEENAIGDSAEGITTYLNVPNVYRAAGQAKEALSHYQKVEEIYCKQGVEKEYRGGALYNNMSVAYLELGKSEDAMRYCEKAIDVLKAIPEVWDECAAAYSNLAGVLLGSAEPDIVKADACMDEALKLFEGKGDSTHFCSVLAMKAYIAYLKKDLQGSLELYEKAMKETMKYFGRNADYERLERNYKGVQALLNGENR